MKAVRALLGIAVIVAAVTVAVNVIPPYYHNYQIQDVIADEARMNTYTQKTAEDIKDTVFRKCKDNEIPVTRDQINVQRDGQSVAIWMDYTVHLDLPAYPLDLQFHPSSRNKTF